MDLEMLFWAAIIAKAVSILAVAYLAWVGQKAFRRPPEQDKEKAWKYRGVEKQHETGSLVPSAAH